MIAHRLVRGQDLQQNGKPKRHQDRLSNLRRRVWEHKNEDTCQHDTSGALDTLVEETRWLVHGSHKLDIDATPKTFSRRTIPSLNTSLFMNNRVAYKAGIPSGKIYHHRGVDLGMLVLGEVALDPVVCAKVNIVFQLITGECLEHYRADNRAHKESDQQ